MKGICQNPECGRSFEWGAGKERLYCGPACRQKMCRERKKQRTREQREQELAQLQGRLRTLRLHPCVVEILEEILRLDQSEYGLKVAQLVTKALEMHSQFVQKINEKPR